MDTTVKAALIALVLYSGIAAQPASGQIASHVDAQGRRVFVNAERPVPPARAVAGATSRPAAPAWAAQYAGYSREQLEQLANDAAKKHNVDPALVKAVIQAESSWNPNAVSYKGASGLMQLMPAKASELGVTNAFDPEQNVNAGVRHLRELLEKYDGDLYRALAAYNAGSGAVDRAGGVPNYRETKTYVQKITNAYFRPESGRDPAQTPAPKPRPIIRTVDAKGRVIFTND